MVGRVVFGEVVGQVDYAWCPGYFKHFLRDAVLEPIKPHVDGLASFLLKIVLEDAIGGAVVSA